MVPTWDFNNKAPMRRDALHCYGVEEMAGPESLDIFSEYQRRGVGRLNDAPCNVTFSKEGVSVKVIEELKLGQSIEDI